MEWNVEPERRHDGLKEYSQIHMMNIVNKTSNRVKQTNMFKKRDTILKTLFNPTTVQKTIWPLRPDKAEKSH